MRREGGWGGEEVGGLASSGVFKQAVSGNQQDISNVIIFLSN